MRRLGCQRAARGRRLLEQLTAMNVDIAGVVRRADRPTIQKTRIMAGSQHVLRIDRESRGDITPETGWGRMIAVAIGLVGMVFVGVTVAIGTRALADVARQHSNKKP